VVQRATSSRDQPAKCKGVDTEQQMMIKQEEKPHKQEEATRGYQRMKRGMHKNGKRQREGVTHLLKQCKMLTTAVSSHW